MMKELKITCLLLLSVSLIGCGLGEPVQHEEEVVDDVRPEVTQVNKPLGNELAPNADEIRLQLTEAIDESTLSNLEEVEIVSQSGFVLKGTWNYSADTLELVYTINRKNDQDVEEDIPFNQSFTIILGENAPTVTDFEGNRLRFNETFSTASLHDIDIEISGLANGEELVVQELTSGISLTIDSSSNKFVINTNLEFETEYLLNITQHPSDGAFCTFDKASGTVLTQNAAAKITCSQVVPYDSSAPNWNDYYSDGTNFIHGGERRSFTLIDPVYKNCTSITASDANDAFQWSCEEITGSDPAAIKIFSTALKPGKGLIDLVETSIPPKWEKNTVSVKHGDNVIFRTTSAIWWNNPVLSAPQNKTLDTAGAVYTVTSATPQNYVIQAPKISLVISKFITLTSPTIATGGAIEINGVSNSWIEGTLDAGGSETGITINSAGYTILRNVTVSNASGNGIDINQTANTFLDNVVSFENGGHGISVAANLNDNGTTLNNIVAVNNEGSGLYIDSSRNKINNVISLNNKGNGATITKSRNTLTQLYTSNNSSNGLAIQGAQNNIISSLNSASNDGNGVLFTITSSSPFKNLIVNATLANNLGAGIKFDDTVAQDTIDGAEGSVFYNVLDAFNADTTCGVNTCSGVTTITTASADITDLFSYVKVSKDSEEIFIKEFSAAKNNYNFENQFQSWSNNAAPTSNAGAGSCRLDGAVCRKLDLRLSSTDTLALNVLGAPNTVLSYTYRGGTTPFDFLNNSQEISDDEIGNDNGLCEANEACIATTNIGTYFGEGEKIDISGNATADGIGITLKAYQTNGNP